MNSPSLVVTSTALSGSASRRRTSSKREDTGRCGAASRRGWAAIPGAQDFVERMGQRLTQRLTLWGPYLHQLITHGFPVR